MAKIGLLDVDGHNFPNIPLMKISAYHKSIGDDVEFVFPMMHYDKIYKSKVFSFTPDFEGVLLCDELHEGGSGYAIKLIDGKEVYNKERDGALPDEIERQCPDYSLYPQYSEAFGFCTRGCPRGCPFCHVASKEGKKARQVADVKDFYTGQKEIKLLDANLLACADRERILKELAETGAYIDFTQGLDIRLTEGIIPLINAIKVKRIHFAWDNPKQDLTKHFERFKAQYKSKDYRRLAVYVLTNYDSTLEEDLYRVYTLRDLGFDPYVMIYDKEHSPQQARALQRYVNNRIIFRTVDRFEDFDSKRG